MAAGLGRKGDIWTYGSWGCMKQFAQEITVLDVQAHTAEVPVKGVADGEAIDFELSQILGSMYGVPVEGRADGEQIDMKASEGFGKLKVMPVESQMRLDLSQVNGVLERIAGALEGIKAMDGGA